MELLGYKIPPKARVVVNAWAIARDPKIWQDPEKFWPERFDSCSKDFKGFSYRYFPFGAGRRICPGTTFALAGMKHFLARLLFRFDWKIPHGGSREEFDIEEVFDGTMKRKQDLCLIAIPYDDDLKASLAAVPQY
ncbi:Cytochrome P450 71D9 [Apostasia shenzhenica]|uniref:Cytochrome P450 71D9 n=1 Tax=Apostasia shenzhenica TaxID=1088818 RepID=A0A2I0B5L2_9ASPA|nr:Cytochrome P450 71D9 [Apostasia shenzhenica]